MAAAGPPAAPAPVPPERAQQEGVAEGGPAGGAAGGAAAGGWCPAGAAFLSMGRDGCVLLWGFAAPGGGPVSPAAAVAAAGRGDARLQPH
eukprot:gene25094-61657_t